MRNKWEKKKDKVGYISKIKGNAKTNFLEEMLDLTGQPASS